MPEEFDFSIFGEDAETVSELCDKPEDIQKLLLTKRKANAEAKTLRENLEQLQVRSEEQESRFEQLKSESAKKLIDSRFKIEALSKGIRPDRMEAAARLANLEFTDEPDIERMVIEAVEKIEEEFPELFESEEPPPQVDNSGFGRHKGNPYIEAKQSGDAMGMLKALRER